MEKTCKKCGKTKDVFEFYGNHQMVGGCYNTCKECTREYAKKRRQRLQSDQNWVEKEKSRHREKYHRLGYRDRHKPSPKSKKRIMEKYKMKFPEKIVAHRLSQSIVRPGFHVHHWSYVVEHAKDVFYLTNEDHFTAHRFLIYDQERMQYRTTDGVLLDSRQAHEAYVSKMIKKAKQ